MSHNQKNVLLVVGIIAALLVVSAHKIRLTKPHVPTVGLIKTASHPALDAAEHGFIEALRQSLGDTVHIVQQNAEGIMHQAQALAHAFSNNADVDLIFSIATPATQAALNNTRLIKKPVVFTAVTSTDILGIAPSDTMIAGCCDCIDTNAFIDAAITLVPHAHTYALLFNQAEPNAVFMAKSLEAALEKSNRSVVIVAIQQESEMSMAARIACQKADAIICPLDNSVAMSIDCIAERAYEAKKPLFVSDNMLMRKGVLASFGVDYHQLGRESGHKALAILKTNASPHEVGISTQCSGSLQVNNEALIHLKLAQQTTHKGD